MDREIEAKRLGCVRLPFVKVELGFWTLCKRYFAREREGGRCEEKGIRG